MLSLLNCLRIWYDRDTFSRQDRGPYLECIHGVAPAAGPAICKVSQFNPLESRGNYSVRSNDMKLVHWPLMGGVLHSVQ